MTERANNDAGAPEVALPHGPIDVVGQGKVGHALAAALAAAGATVRGPYGRGHRAGDAAVVILCVPDREIAAAAARVAPGRMVGHTSASAPLSLLAPHEAFNLHPLLSITSATRDFTGITAAVDGSTAPALERAQALAFLLGMQPRQIPGSHRALYHAAASAAANFLVTLEELSARLAEQAGVERAALVPLAQSALDNWRDLGARGLTGPVARGDEATILAQRQAVAAAAPDALPLWDALVDATRLLARSA